MTQWSDLDPGAGEMIGPMGLAALLRGQETALAEVYEGTRRAREELSDDTWSGEAAVAWRGVSATLRERQERLVEGVGPVHGALDDYATAVVDIALTARIHQNAREDAMSRRNLVYSLTSYTPPAVVAQVERLAEQGALDLDHAEVQLRALARARQDADQALIRALAIPSTTNWTQRKAVLARAGITDVESLSTTKLVDAYADLADRLMDGSMTADEAQQLADFLDVWGDDPEVMDAYFAKLGPARTRDLVNELGVEIGRQGVDDALLLAAATGLRHGLATASQTWDEKAATDFADAMIESAFPGVGGGYSTISWLFSDPRGDRMGAEFTVAVLDRIDAIERGPRDNTNSRLEDASVMPGGSWLFKYEGTTDEAAWGQPAIHVLQTLATYPEATLEWFSTSDPDPVEGGDERKGDPFDLGKARIAYWFGDRDWSVKTTGDGFETPAALWLSMQSVTGAPGSGGYDPGPWNLAEKVSGTIMQQLPDNASFTTENMSTDAAIGMAAAFTVELPMLTESAVIGTADSWDTPNSQVLPWAVEERAVLAVDRRDLAEFLGIVGQNGSAGTLLRESVVAYQNGLIATAAADPTASIGAGVSATDGVLTRVMGLQAMLDGPAHGTQIADAAQLDAHHKAITDWIGKGAEAVVRIPGGDRVVSSVGNRVAQWAVESVWDFGEGYAKSEGVKLLASHIPATWTGNESATMAASTEECLARSKELQREVEAVAWAIDPNSYVSTDRAAYYEQLAQTYRDVYGGFRDLADGKAGEAACVAPEFD
ncbi:hypothetical protein CLV28_0939 [Sediminihabitans luteus]|uniref:Uncharacterized protein n=1 Tax=Sediminihabitans luteus TaxID=1138585 RepID=A0A2M9D0U8_9CELL|nr:hypothetical protein [Sediminihabitans luteus]PJJ77713.1 hypothetical protein CLV28_0939 [Sediminihabitans luteus]GIJ00060.1 hypothetical protein Slu03_24370 [Sediminihabitans luteus]